MLTQCRRGAEGELSDWQEGVGPPHGPQSTWEGHVRLQENRQGVTLKEALFPHPLQTTAGESLVATCLTSASGLPTCPMAIQPVTTLS